MKKQNQKKSKGQEFVVKAAPVSFEMVPIRNGHDFDTVAEMAFEVEIDGKVEQVLVQVRRGTPQFTPVVGKQYLMDVKLRRNAAGKWSGRATPCRDILPLLSEREWNSDLRDALTVRLTFRKGNGGRPIAFYDGNPVFPARGSEVVTGRPQTYLLLQRDGFVYHAALIEGASERSGRRGSEETTVELRIPVAKSVMVQSEDDLDYRTERKSIGDLLGIGGDGATVDSVKAAAAAKIKALRLDKPKPFILQRMTEECAAAIREAEKKALALLGEESDEALTDGATDAEPETGDEDEGIESLDTLVAE